MTSISSILSLGNVSQPQATQLTPNPSPSSNTSAVSFGDVMDALNPLQHIPAVSNLYRAITGSQISATSQIAGDTLYGAAFGGISAITGLASSVANVAVKQFTGQDIGQHVVSALSGATSTASITTASITALTPSATALPTPPATTLGDTSMFSGQIANAVRLISHASSSQSAAQYQRAQTLDTVNQHLLHMTG